jgi:hypothetical protein
MSLSNDAFDFSSLSNVVEVPNGWNSIQITQDGAPKTLYVASGSYASGGNRVTIPYNNRAILSQTPNMDPKQYYRPNLLGGSVEYDVDLS